jgi:hypothetical protein
MTKTKKAPAKAKVAAKAETFAHEGATRMLEEGFENATEFARKYGEAAETSLKTVAERAAASQEMLRTIGARNMDFFTRTFEHGVEATQALTAAKDPRAVMDIQTGFAKSVVAEYTKEVSAQTELWLNVWREAAKSVGKSYR